MANSSVNIDRLVGLLMVNCDDQRQGVEQRVAGRKGREGRGGADTKRAELEECRLLNAECRQKVRGQAVFPSAPCFVYE